MNISQGVAEWADKALPELTADEEPVGPNGVVTAAAVFVVGAATRSLVKAAWKRWRGEDPPANPASSSTSWGEAVAWTVAVSAAVGTARLLTRRVVSY